MNAELLSTSSEWSFEAIERFEQVIGESASNYGLATFPNQIELISAEQMMDAYASAGMPVGYTHWSYGKRLVGVQQQYKRGALGLAYEIVINSDPCISYLMEENTLPMQALVIAHAAFGHNSFFKGNYLFNAWTNPDAIIDYLVFARDYVRQCEEREGETEVESFLDSCHALMNYGVSAYKRPPALSVRDEVQRQQERECERARQVDDLWRTLPQSAVHSEANAEVSRFPAEPQENLLYFIEKNAPQLETWQRELVRIVRKLAQYFYPQRQTKVMNEGWACFWHYTLLYDLYNRDRVDDGFMLEVLQSHTNVTNQPAFDDPWYSGINPYALGFRMMADIRRISENPTAEDKQWFPALANTDWRDSVHAAMHDFKDESFILQYLSPKLMRDFHLFSVLDHDANPTLEIAAIHDDHGYETIRRTLASQYSLAQTEPDIQVWDVNLRGDRSLLLRHVQHQGRPLAEDATRVLEHAAHLWGFTVRLEEVDTAGSVQRTLTCEAEDG